MGLIKVSMPVWALGSFLPEAEEEVKASPTTRLNARVGFGVFSTERKMNRLVSHRAASQCPCGLWGLFYQDR